MLPAMPPAARPIVFVSDFGLGNEWVGICHSVLAGISPQSPIVDLTHLIRPLEVQAGALLLADSMPYIAEDAVVLGVVDPNVGNDREVAIETASGRYLVGPDNGLLSLAWEAAGGVATAVEIASPDVVRPARAEPFRAPDTLCPPAAHLAAGMPIEQLGPTVDPATLTALILPEPEIADGEIRGEVRGSTYADFTEGEYGVIFDERGWMENRARESGERARGAGPFTRPPRVDQPLARALTGLGRDAWAFAGVGAGGFEPPFGHMLWTA
jgi:S-adenosylmethionine hydrolase